MPGLYIHVPFCSKVCDYCDFSVLAAPSRMYAEYLDLLLLELDTLQRRYPEKWAGIDTLYLGGGTPSILSPELLTRLFTWLKNSGINIAKLREASMEVNPESCLDDRLNVAMEFGIGRFSLGVQTFDQNLLDRIGRAHSVETALKAIEKLLALRNANIQINADLMFSLPGQTVEQFHGDIKRMAGFGLDHISFYGLNVSEHSMLAQHLAKGDFKIDEDVYAPMYKGGVQILEQAGYHRYEVSNFARGAQGDSSHESIHNKNYWERGEYFGAGPGAHSYLSGIRFNAPARYSHWRTWVADACPEDEYENDALSRESAIAEVIWLSLRQSYGLDLNKLQSEFNYIAPQQKIDHWIQKGFLEQSANIVRLVGDGWLFMDQVVEDLMP